MSDIEERPLSISPSTTDFDVSRTMSSPGTDADLSSIDIGSMASCGSAGEEEVRTLFVSGLSIDTKERELYLLFRTYEGYESCLLREITRPGRATVRIGFVTFKTREHAAEAKRKLQGVKFDPEQSNFLRLEFAKSNTKGRTRPWTLRPPKKVDQENQAPKGVSRQPQQPMYMQQPMMVSAPQMINCGPMPMQPQPFMQYQPTSAMYNMQMMPPSMPLEMPLCSPMMPMAPAAQPESFLAQYAPQQPPPMMNPGPIMAPMVQPPAENHAAECVMVPACLSVSNLSEAHLHNPSELKNLFGSFPSFMSLTVQSIENIVTALVFYSDANSARNALSSLQNHQLYDLPLHIKVAAEGGMKTSQIPMHGPQPFMIDPAPRVLGQLQNLSVN